MASVPREISGPGGTADFAADSIGRKVRKAGSQMSVEGKKMRQTSAVAATRVPHNRTIRDQGPKGHMISIC